MTTTSNKVTSSNSVNGVDQNPSLAATFRMTCSEMDAPIAMLNAANKCSAFKTHCKSLRSDSFLLFASVRNGVGTYECFGCGSRGKVTGGMIGLSAAGDAGKVNFSKIPAVVWAIVLIWLFVVLIVGKVGR